jgi:hypothetical protein
LWALDDPRRWPALRPLLADGATGRDIIRELETLRASEPRQGLPPYLLAKQMQNRGAWADCARLAREALERELPSTLFVQEALRMLGIASWHLADREAARDAFTRLGGGAPPGRANEARRWLQLVGN